MLINKENWASISLLNSWKKIVTIKINDDYVFYDKKNVKNISILRAHLFFHWHYFQIKVKAMCLTMDQIGNSVKVIHEMLVIHLLLQDFFKYWADTGTKQTYLMMYLYPKLKYNHMQQILFWWLQNMYK